MANPTPYTQAYDFSDFASHNPDTPLPGDRLDIELAELERTTDEIIEGLADVRRSDGALVNGIVTRESLSSSLLALTGADRGAWVTATAYVVGDLVTESSRQYQCLVAHTSGTFATDLAAGKWSLTAAESSEDAAASAVAAAASAATAAGIVAGFSAFWLSVVAATTAAASWLLLLVLGHLTTRTLLKAIAPSVGMAVYLSEAGREGTFVWRLGDYSTHITADTREGVYVKATSIASTVGAWVRDNSSILAAEWFYETADGTDMAAATQAAVNLLEAISANEGGTIELGRATYYWDSTVTGTSPGIRIIGQGAGDTAYSTQLDVAPTKVIVRQNTGAGIWLKGMSSEVSGFYITSDTTRAAAAFDITKPGIRIEAVDTAQGRADRCVVTQMRVDRQPGDGIMTVGDVIGTDISDNDIYLVKGMGIRCDPGTYTGIVRTNPLYPGLMDIRHNRVGYAGGNAIAISNPDVVATTYMGIRIHIDQLDCFGCANDAAVRYSETAVWLFGENCTVQNSGIGGSGWDGAVLTNEQREGIYAAGRGIRLVNNRYIETTQPVRVGYIAAQPTEGVTIELGIVSNASLTIAEAVVVESGAKGVHVNLEYWADFTLPVTPDIEGVTWKYRGFAVSPAVARTIASDILTVNENHVSVRGEGATTDNLISILFGPTAAIPRKGAIVTLYNENAYSIIVKHASGGGNIRTTLGTDVALASNSAITFVSDGTRMTEVGAGFLRADATTGVVASLVRFHSASGTATPAGGSAAASIRIGSASVGVFIGTGAPTLSAAKGSLYLRTDATTTTTRLYINTDGGTTWANFTASA